MNLDTLKPAYGSVKNSKRIGRGTGSGRGGTSTRGHKGAKSRSGYSSKAGFEGGQMPLHRRLPKFGFKNPNRVEFKSINLDALQSLVDRLSVQIINVDLLIQNGFISKNDKIKVLGRGELKSKIEIQANAFSQTAISAIEAIGGKAIIL
ncbi:MAG: 50S ribosomal protein L15 [Cytophagales bacterium]|nr:MAG: 50S ribosomal protein L15 [Cytophagales bacterium]